MQQQIRNKECKVFEINQESKVLKALKKFFKEEKNPLSEDQAVERNDLFLTDAANVCLIEAKSEEAKRCLSRFLSSDFKQDREMPSLNYSSIEGKGNIECKYSVEYLKGIINLFDACSKGFGLSIKINFEYPATFEDEHFKVILAPKVDVD